MGAYLTCSNVASLRTCGDVGLGAGLGWAGAGAGLGCPNNAAQPEPYMFSSHRSETLIFLILCSRLPDLSKTALLAVLGLGDSGCCI